MPWYHYLWTDEAIEHIDEHGISPEDFEQVANDADRIARSDSSGLPCVFGHTDDGRYIIAVFEQVDETTRLPVTAYEVPEPRN